MLVLDFTQFKSDYSFFHKGNGDKYVAFLVYVDNIIITWSHKEGINFYKQKFSQQFKLKDLGSLGYFLGFEIAKSDKGIFVPQRNYALQLIEDACFIAAKPTNTPTDPRTNLFDSIGEEFQDPSQYRRLIGRLIYLNITRFDISFVVQKLSQFMSSPCVLHFTATCHLLKYLKQSPWQGVFFSKDSSFQIKGFCDSDWTKCLDTRGSVMGFCIFVVNSLMSSKSKK